MIDFEVKIGDSIIENSTLLEKSTVGNGSKIVGSLIGKNCHIGDNCVLENVIIDHNSKIPDGAKITE